MAIQLAFDFNSKPSVEDDPIIMRDIWLDVSDIARGVGFTETVHLSIALNDALEPRHERNESNYDQLVYDALWLANLKLSLDQSQSATLNFVFQDIDWKVKKIRDVSLRLRVQAHKPVVLLGLLSDFQEETWINPHESA